MDLRLHDSGCWQARCGDVHMGCTLSLEELRELSPRLLTQVHGTLIHDDQIYRDEKTCGDGLVSDRAGVALVIKTADCVPVTFSDGHRIGAIHAGWGGTAAGIVSRLAEHFKPERLFAVIGPAISADNYEVDADLYADWLERDSRLAAFLAPAPASGIIVQGTADTVVTSGAVQKLVDKLRTQKHITIHHDEIPRANHFFEAEIDELMASFRVERCVRREALAATLAGDART